MENGNLEPKKSAFRVRTMMGSSQGLRQSQMGTDGMGMGTHITRPGTRGGEEKDKQRDSLLGKSELRETESETNLAVPAEEKGEGYTVKNFRAGRSTNLKQQSVVKLSKLYTYDDTEIFSTRFSPDDTQLAIGLSNGTVEIKNLAGTKKGESFPTGAEELPVSHIRWKSNKRLLVSNVEGFLIEYDCQDGNKIASIREADNQILALDYNAELLKICTAGKDCAVRIYDDASKRLVRTYEKGSWYSPGHSNRVFSVKFRQQEPNTLITGGWDSSIFIWDIRQPKCVAAFVGPNISGDTIDCRDTVLLTGSHRAKESLELWDIGTRKRICEVEIEAGKMADNAYVYACQFSKTGEDQIIAGMAVRNEIRIWDRNVTYNPTWSISDFERAVYTLDWGNKGKKLVFGGGSSKVFVFKFALPTDKD